MEPYSCVDKGCNTQREARQKKNNDHEPKFNRGAGEESKNWSNDVPVPNILFQVFCSW